VFPFNPYAYAEREAAKTRRKKCFSIDYTEAGTLKKILMMVQMVTSKITQSHTTNLKTQTRGCFVDNTIAG
jgi:hypothetical protein